MTRNEDVLDRNLERLVRRWADAPSPERAARARQEFLAAATAPSRELPSQRRWGLIATAAGLLICALVYGSLFLAGPGRSGSPGQSQDEAKIKALIEALGNANIVRRDYAALDLMALGAKARPLLTEALKDPNVEIRVRARDVLDRITVGGKNGALEPTARERELENNRAFAAILSQQINNLDAECSAKASRINDLQRQLDAANTRLTKQETDQAVFERQLEVHLAQIAELQRQLEEAKKKK
jgi:hypothetical protein